MNDARPDVQFKETSIMKTLLHEIFSKLLDSLEGAGIDADSILSDLGHSEGQGRGGKGKGGGGGNGGGHGRGA